MRRRPISALASVLLVLTLTNARAGSSAPQVNVGSIVQKINVPKGGSANVVAVNTGVINNYWTKLSPNDQARIDKIPDLEKRIDRIDRKRLSSQQPQQDSVIAVRLLLKEGSIGKAAEMGARLADSASSNAVGLHLWAALLFVNNEDFPSALEHARKARSIEPNNPELTLFHAALINGYLESTLRLSTQLQTLSSEKELEVDSLGKRVAELNISANAAAASHPASEQRSPVSGDLRSSVIAAWRNSIGQFSVLRTQAASAAEMVDQQNRAFEQTLVEAVEQLRISPQIDPGQEVQLFFAEMGVLCRQQGELSDPYSNELLNDIVARLGSVSATLDPKRRGLALLLPLTVCEIRFPATLSEGPEHGEGSNAATCERTALDNAETALQALESDDHSSALFLALLRLSDARDLLEKNRGQEALSRAQAGINSLKKLAAMGRWPVLPRGADFGDSRLWMPNAFLLLADCQSKSGFRKQSLANYLVAIHQFEQVAVGDLALVWSDLGAAYSMMAEAEEADGSNVEAQTAYDGEIAVYARVFRTVSPVPPNLLAVYTAAYIRKFNLSVKSKPDCGLVLKAWSVGQSSYGPAVRGVATHAVMLGNCTLDQLAPILR